MNPGTKIVTFSETISRLKIPVLISVEPGFLRDSIQAILQSFHFVSVLSGVSGEDHSLSEIGKVRPEIVLVDCSPNNPRWMEFLGAIHEQYPEIRCLAIADTSSICKLALEIGAVEVLANGFTSQELRLAVQRLARLQKKSSPDAVER